MPPLPPKSKAKKTARKPSATPKAARAKRSIKPQGNAQSRREVRDATKRALAACAHLTPTHAAAHLGVGVDDVRNMRAGNQLTVAILVKMIRIGGYDPRSVLMGPALRKLPKTRDTRGAQQRLINARMRALVWSGNGMEWARQTGLSIVGVYGIRYDKTANIKLGTILAFVAVGPKLEDIIFGS
jgi:hypothetical protein